MFRSLKMGKAFGIPIYVHTTFFLLPLYTLYVTRHDPLASTLLALVMLVSLFGCVLLHELGHALMARLFGIATRDITLYPIGGVARLESTGNSPREELCIALAGPAVNLVLVLLLLPLVVLALLAGLVHNPASGLGAGGLLGVLATYLTGLCLGNAVLFLFNLVPAFPMDGGRVLRALLGMGMSHLRATEISATVGLFAAIGLGLLGFLLDTPSLVLVAGFVAFAGQQELAMLRQREMQRRMGAEVLEALPADEPTVHPGLAGFTGFLWDHDNRVWVRWINGRPVPLTR